jgi:hypothetical protein
MTQAFNDQQNASDTETYSNEARKQGGPYRLPWNVGKTSNGKEHQGAQCQKEQPK